MRVIRRREVEGRRRAISSEVVDGARVVVGRMVAVAQEMVVEVVVGREWVFAVYRQLMVK